MIDDTISCSFCGANLKPTNSNNPYLTCEFCGSVTVNKIFQEKKSKINKSEIVGDSSTRNPDKIIYVERGIYNISQIIEIYSDPEIDTIRRVDIRGNKLISLNKISRFKLSYLDVSYNDIRVIDEFPRLEEKYNGFEYKTTRGNITIDLRHNENLTGFETHLINKINNYTNIKSIDLILIGCTKFSYDNLSLLNFKSIIDEDEGKVRIIPNKKVLMPQSLIISGFKEKKEEIKFNESDEVYKIVVWELHQVIPQKIKIGSEYSSTRLDKRKTDLIYNAIKSSDTVNAIETTKSLFNINDYAAKNLINGIKKTEYYFPVIKAESSGHCFIATASMGDYNHPVVVDLRSFRDDWLLKQNWGVSFINWYYTHGPKAANIIKNSKILRKVTLVLIIKPLHLLVSTLINK